MFGEIQVSLINYFSSNEAYKLLPDLSISLFRDWYKTHNQFQWGIVFEDEESIGPTIIALLERNQNHFEGFQFNSFMLKRKSDPSELKKKSKTRKTQKLARKKLRVVYNLSL
ncbi:hypothetical protein PGTUg99_050199 [Puccinia graminis f. sp. tritici]|uniref:Uncharacterized protein n=1 Tax=Puccinia graminis f. sp. tritici TaxID=56615 RepID=A0A5B0QES9_PUCGR|nr:hypothetical protein PGTUg99_050199 [Puccinia graminis f. sp. tritici]